MGRKRSPPRNACPPLSDPPNPVPCTLPSHNPQLSLHTPQLRSLPRHNSPSHRGPRSPSRTVPAPALTSHPTLSHRRSPTRSGRSPGSTSSHTHPPHFLALASLPAPKELSPASPRSPPHPQTSSPRHGGLPASGPEAHPGHMGQAPPRQPLLPPSRAEGSLLRRGV